MEKKAGRPGPKWFAVFVSLEDHHYMTSELCELAQTYPNNLRQRLNLAGVTQVGYGQGPSGKIEAMWNGEKLRALGVKTAQALPTQ